MNPDGRDTFFYDEGNLIGHISNNPNDVVYFYVRTMKKTDEVYGVTEYPTKGDANPMPKIYTTAMIPQHYIYWHCGLWCDFSSLADTNN